jgi:hypothetical protein
MRLLSIVREIGVVLRFLKETKNAAFAERKATMKDGTLSRERRATMEDGSRSTAEQL